MRTASFILAPIITVLVLSGTHERRTTTVRAVPEQTGTIEETATDTALPPPPRPAAADLTSIYEATTTSGSIGALNELFPDEAADNLFHVHLDRLPQENESVWLEYDLHGLADHDAASRSINHALSIGSGTSETSSEWSHQRERIPANSLELGRNSIWFHAPRGPLSHYELRNVRLVIGPTNEEGGIVLTNARLTNTEGTVYVKGLLTGNARHATEVGSNGQALRLSEGAFEGVLHVEPDARQITLSALKANGERVVRTFVLEAANGRTPPCLEEEANILHEAVKASAGQTLFLDGAELDIPPHALKQDERITAIALTAREVPPTGQDLINVCRNGAGYRFLPDGTTFTTAVGITLPFDTARIPAGYGPGDVRTFYFDEDQRRWLAIPRDSIQPRDGRVRSLTKHFSDYINGIIQVPESPETMGYTPTSIKDYKAGDVSAGITPIAPPQANNTGAVTTRFPLKLPQGRQGMQPDLAIQYNSEGGNGWMGLGWNLSTPSISIETRWGVPRYSDTLETETYLLDGEMMSPVTHRAEWVARNTSGNKTFHTRVEGSFQRILRNGNAPEDYWWEVTEKDGTRKLYGGDGDNVEENAVLRIGNSTSAIAKWMLYKEVDSNGNTITYTYDTVQHAGTDGSPNMGRQIYPKRIRYTGREGGNAGPYSVEFDFDTTGRADKQINCRLGFKEVTANLLQRVDVKYSGDVIRSYHLKYKEGAFIKTLLDSIVEYDANGELFYGHGMGYYDDVRDGEQYEPYRNGDEWDSPLPDDNLSYGALNPNVTEDDEQVSLLGGTLTDNYSFGGSANVGPIGNPFLQSFTIGGSFGYSRSKGAGVCALVDINGDNLPDKLFRKNQQLYYRPNLAGTNTFGFGTDLLLTGLASAQFSETKTRSTNRGVEAHAGPIFIGKSWGNSKTTTPTFLLDRNGDGLMDISRNGSVSFNYRNAQGVHAFTPWIDSTENPIEAGEAIALQPDYSADMAAILAECPLVDVVKVWVAPYAGLVNVGSTITLVPDTSQEFALYNHKDGVTASIESGEQVLCSITIDTSQYGDLQAFSCSTLQGFPVAKGQRIFFRLGSIVDGAYDQVDWDKLITYTEVFAPALIPPSAIDMRLDANAKDVYAFSGEHDYSLFNKQGVAFKSHGTVLIKGVLHKPVTSDTVIAEIVKRDSLGNMVEVVRSSSFPWTTAFDTSLTDTVEVDTNQFLEFRLVASTNVEWDSISWSPEVAYIQLDELDDTLLVDTAGEPLLKFKPVVGCTMFNEPRPASFVGDIRFTRPFVPNTSGELRWVPEVDRPNYFPDPTGSTAAGTITFSVKRRHELVSKQSRYFPVGTQFSPDWEWDTLQVSPSDTLYFEVHIDNRCLSDSFRVSLTSESIDVLNHTEISSLLAVHTLPYDSVDLVFGPLYRRWGQFGYNYAQIDGATFSTPLEEDSLHYRMGTINSSLFDQLADDDEANVDTLENSTSENWENPLATTFTAFFVNPDTGAWFGIDDRTFVARNLMSSSRLGEDDVVFADDPDLAQDVITAPIKVNKDDNVSKSWGVNVILGLGYSSSKGDGNSRVIIDSQDLDGDRYPDVVSEEQIQGTSPLGGYEATTRPHSGGGHYSVSASDGWSVGGGFVKPNFSNSASPSAGLVESVAFFSGNPIKNLFKSQKAEETAKTSIGVNLSMNVDPTIGKDSALVSWNDVNGDGLADKVYEDGTVRLNLGRAFLEPESWDYDAIRSGQCRDFGYGGGGSLSVVNMSFAAGVSASRTENGTVTGLMDVNGDGLVDVVQSIGTGPIPWTISSVRFNTGTGFAEAVNWDVAENGWFDAGRTIGEAVNGSYTYGFTIPLPPLKFSFNVNGSWGHGFSRTETQFADLDGDAYPDFLYSADDNELVVRPSTIRRTNLLKAVHSPFSAKWQVDYEVAGNTYELPQSKWVMKDLLVWDGFEGDGPDSSRTTFEYADGQYDRRERETYGFGTVDTHEWDTEANDNEPYRTTVQTYDVSGYYTKGLPLVKTVQDGQGNKFIETANTYQLKLLNGTDAQPNYNSDNDGGTAFPALVKTEDRFYEGESTAGITKTITFGYDSIGNVTEYKDLGFVGQDDEVVATIGYHYLEDPYIVSTPESISVSVAGEVRRARTQDIDEATGNITAIHQTIDNQTMAHYEFYYTEEGNLDSIVRPANHKGKRMHYGYTYDDAVKTYVTEVRDAYGYHSKSTYEYRFGQLQSTTDMNGEVTNYAIDDRGRVETVTGPYELTSGAPYTIKLEYFPDANRPHSVVTHYDPEHPGGDGIRTVTFLDGQFRPLQVKKSAVIRDENGNEDERWIASGRVKFDAFGRTVESRYPVESTLPLDSFVYDPDTEDPTITTFDILDRELTVTLPDGLSTTTTTYDVASPNGNGNALWKRVTDALDNYKDSYTDVREREIARTDHGPNGAIWTAFRYNGIGELIDVTDHGGNVTSYTYDQLGRKLTYDHPDGGLTEFTYDAAGNLLTKNTTNLREMFPDGGPIKYSYDYQRVDTINYPRNYMNQVVYVYGKNTDTTFHRVGRVKVQLDGSGGQEFFYGPLGEVEKTIRTIVVSQTDIRTFVSEERYDTWNRIQVMKYPDGDSVDYAYNTAGRLKQVTSTKDNFSYDVVKDIGYDKFEQRVYLKHGNDVETRYAYEPDRRRLSTLRVDQPNGTRIMDNEYGYDQVNNVLSLVNNRAVPNDGQGGAMSSIYEYDNLYRLTEATGQYTGSAREDAYTLTMQYDDLHNIRRKRQTHSSTFSTATLSNYDFEYTYDSAAPHTPSKVGYRAYDYDANGNLMDWDEDAPRMGTRHMAWDEENRLQTVNDAGYVSQYTYDAAGERVLKSHGGMEGVFINGAPVGLINHRDNYTIYVSPYLVHAEHGFTKHYYIEGQRVTSRTGNGHFITGPMPSNGITAGRVDFASRFLAMQQAGQQQVVDNAPVPGIPTMGGYNGQPEISGTPTYLNNIGTYAAPDPAEGWPMPPVPPGAPGTPPTTPMPTVTNETVTAGYAFVTDANAAEMNRYFFHPDHLGSASYITGTDGTARQHLEYMAFGEVFVEEQNAADPLDYLFNGKELDRVTGLYYYGARYYDPVASMWASLDPMAEKYLARSPYCFSGLNPIAFIDPDGNEEEPAPNSSATASDKVDPYTSPAGDIGNLAQTGSKYLVNGDSWRSLLNAPKKGMSKFAHFVRNLAPSMRKAGNRFTELKESVTSRAGKWNKLGGVGKVADAVDAGAGLIDLGRAIGNKDIGAGVVALGGLAETAALATAHPLVGLSYSVGKAIGGALDKKFNLSSRIGDAMFQLSSSVPEVAYRANARFRPTLLGK